MKEQDDFFSPNHRRLLNIAIWLKYLAWVLLAINVFDVIITFFQEKALYIYAGMFAGSSTEFISFLTKHSIYASNLAITILSRAFNGVAHFLVLIGIALGLNMIVETDINYREQKGDA